ncbi:unnamed protein product [Rangifer tarandus platyrhynchus]|uniref:Uncharacterized protein n=1 Tax=Rangifer tarandus platyrhynchus TaxID=3082113 RepID=A0ABN8ZHF5_RANTA|nr:unnamed protein product [Rangifer tarandus platyrhynchus]
MRSKEVGEAQGRLGAGRLQLGCWRKDELGRGGGGRGHGPSSGESERLRARGSLGKRSLSPLLPWVPRLVLRGEGESGSRGATLSARCCHVSSLSPFLTMGVYPLGSQIND